MSESQPEKPRVGRPRAANRYEKYTDDEIIAICERDHAGESMSDIGLTDKHLRAILKERSLGDRLKGKSRPYGPKYYATNELFLAFVRSEYGGLSPLEIKGRNLDVHKEITLRKLWPSLSGIEARVVGEYGRGKYNDAELVLLAKKRYPNRSVTEIGTIDSSLAGEIRRRHLADQFPGYFKVALARRRAAKKP